MRVGLIDVDTIKPHGRMWPNLALMKISGWHKDQGDRVEFVRDPLAPYDRVYASKVFTFTPDFDFTPNTHDLRFGGTGYGIKDTDRLPDEIEHHMPDYDLYGTIDTAFGFLSRGCPRGCPFCIVAQKEGRASRKVADLSEWWNGQRNINLLDPNILACPDWSDLLGQLAESRAYVNISQGADIRLMTDEKAQALNRIRLTDIHFAWDKNEDLTDKFRMWRGLARRKYHGAYATVYCLVNYDTDMEFNLHRVYTLRDLGYDPYVMVYDKSNAPKDILRLQRFVNNKFVFKKCRTFEEYRR